MFVCVSESNVVNDRYGFGVFAVPIRRLPWVFSSNGGILFEIRSVFGTGPLNYVKRRLRGPKDAYVASYVQVGV